MKCERSDLWTAFLDMMDFATFKLSDLPRMAFDARAC